MPNLAVDIARMAGFYGVPGAALSTCYFHGRPLTWPSMKTFAWSIGQGALLATAGTLLGVLSACLLGPKSSEPPHHPTPRAIAKGVAVSLIPCVCIGLAAQQFPHHLGRPMEAVAGMVLGTVGCWICVYRDER